MNALDEEESGTITNDQFEPGDQDDVFVDDIDGDRRPWFPDARSRKRDDGNGSDGDLYERLIVTNNPVYDRNANNLYTPLFDYSPSRRHQAGPIPSEGSPDYYNTSFPRKHSGAVYYSGSSTDLGYETYDNVSSTPSRSYDDTLDNTLFPPLESSHVEENIYETIDDLVYDKADSGELIEVTESISKIFPPDVPSTLPVSPASHAGEAGGTGRIPVPEGYVDVGGRLMSVEELDRIYDDVGMSDDNLDSDGSDSATEGEYRLRNLSVIEEEAIVPTTQPKRVFHPLATEVKPDEPVLPSVTNDAVPEKDHLSKLIAAVNETLIVPVEHNENNTFNPVQKQESSETGSSGSAATYQNLDDLLVDIPGKFDINSAGTLGDKYTQTLLKLEIVDQSSLYQGIMNDTDIASDEEHLFSIDEIHQLAMRDYHRNVHTTHEKSTINYQPNSGTTENTQVLMDTESEFIRTVVESKSTLAPNSEQATTLSSDTPFSSLSSNMTDETMVLESYEENQVTSLKLLREPRDRGSSEDSCSTASEVAYFLKRLTDQTVCVGSTCTLTVEVSDPASMVVWYIDGIDLIPEDCEKYTFMHENTVHVLHVHDICEDDEGDYVCALPYKETSCYVRVVSSQQEGKNALNSLVPGKGVYQLKLLQYGSVITVNFLQNTMDAP